MFSIIDTAVDVTPHLARLKETGVKTVIGYMSSINPHEGKCVTPARARAIADARLRLGLVHEGWGGVHGRGISAADGARDGSFCHRHAALLGAPEDACIYFACDTDFSRRDFEWKVVPYFTAIRHCFNDGFYRVGVYGSGSVCQELRAQGLVDLTWLAGSRGWRGYHDWLEKADMVQTVDANVCGFDNDGDTAKGEIGDFVPFAS